MDTIDPDVALPAAVRNPHHVLVPYESSADGQAALSHALDIARAAGVPLSVVAVVHHDPTNVGCSRCRWNASMWNRELDVIAQEELAEAARLVGGSSAVEYDVVRGPQVKAISDAASRYGADLIVLPWRRARRVRALLSRDVAERLSREGRWRVHVAPPAAAGAPSRQIRSGGSSGSG